MRWKRKSLRREVEEELIANLTETLPLYWRNVPNTIATAKTKENEKVDEKNKKRTYTYTRARAQTSAGSFERRKTLSNFQFSQSGPKIRDHAPVMAEVQ